MKKVLLLHGYNGIPQIFYWLKQELEKMDYTVIMPSLPAQEGVRYPIWKQELEHFKQNVEKRYCMYSDNDHIVPFEVLQKHVENVDGIGKMIPNIGHMGRKSNLQTIPEVIEIIKENGR